MSFVVNSKQKKYRKLQRLVPHLELKIYKDKNQMTFEDVHEGTLVSWKGEDKKMKSQQKGKGDLTFSGPAKPVPEILTNFSGSLRWTSKQIMDQC